MAKNSEISVGVDLGGTSLRAAAVDSKGKIRGEAEAKTEPQRGLDPVLDDLAQVIRETAKSAGVKLSQLKGVGLGVPGAVDSEAGRVHLAPNLGWKDLDLVEALSLRLGLRVALDNDVNVAILGEARFGAAKGASSALGVWVGTGIGGGIYLDKKVLRGFHGAAAEIGHSVVLPDGPVCGCGNRGCVEALASRTAIEAEIRRRISQGESSRVEKIMAKSGKTRMTSGVLFKAFEAKDEVVREAIERAQSYLGLAIANWVNILDPEVVVLGGGVAEKFEERFLDPVEARARKSMFRIQGKPTRFRLAKLGDHSGVLGAAALVD